MKLKPKVKFWKSLGVCSFEEGPTIGTAKQRGVTAPKALGRPTYVCLHFVFTSLPYFFSFKFFGDLNIRGKYYYYNNSSDHLISMVLHAIISPKVERG